MEMTNKRTKSYEPTRMAFDRRLHKHSEVNLTLAEIEALTDLLIISPYLGPEGESALLKLTKKMRRSES